MKTRDALPHDGLLLAVVFRLADADHEVALGHVRRRRDLRR